jgi:DNA-binding CsgD family transcriptional regulator
VERPLVAPNGRRVTDRQAALLGLIASGLENKEIAHRLGVVEQTVKEQVSNLLRMFHAPNRAALANAIATYRILGNSRVAPAWRPFLFRDAPIGVAIVQGPDHRFVTCNEAFRRAAGEEVEGRRFADVFPQHPVCRARLDRVLTSGRPEHGDVALQPLPGDDGKPAGVALFVLQPAA